MPPRVVASMPPRPAWAGPWTAASPHLIERSAEASGYTTGAICGAGSGPGWCRNDEPTPADVTQRAGTCRRPPGVVARSALWVDFGAGNRAKGDDDERIPSRGHGAHAALGGERPGALTRLLP